MFEKLEEIFNACYAIGATPCLWGHHGVGKTESVRDYAKKYGFNLVEIRMGEKCDPGDMTGIPQPDMVDMSTIFLAPKSLPRSGKTLLFLDEWNRCKNPELYQALFQLVKEHKMNEYSLPTESGPPMVILGGNPSTDDYDVFDFNDQAFKDRVCDIKFNPTSKDFLEYAKDKLEPSLISYLNAYPQDCSAKVEEFSLPEKAHSHRTWHQRIDAVLKYKKNNDLSRDAFKELLIGFLGPIQALKFLKWEDEQKPVSAKDILKKFDKVKTQLETYTTNSRVDLYASIIEDLKKELSEYEKKEKRIEESMKEYQGLKQFLFVAPKEIAYGFIKTFLVDLQVLNVEKFDDVENIENYPSFLNDLEIEKYFLDWKKSLKTT